MSKPLRIAHLYPDLLNLYADKGNIQTLVRRCEWRGIEVEIEYVTQKSEVQLANYHLVLLGGGSDREQVLVGESLGKSRGEWSDAVEGGLPLLAVCGGYQLLGDFYELPDGTKVKGLELLDLHTVAGAPRLIGNIAIDSAECGRIVGFENHGGRTFHNHSPLGSVISGHGNNGQDHHEGVRYKNIFGTYMHGPLLPKNPRLADLLIKTALDYAHIDFDLAPLDDSMEESAHDAFCARRIPSPVHA